jgi:hypothetical protein
MSVWETKFPPLRIYRPNKKQPQGFTGWYNYIVMKKPIILIIIGVILAFAGWYIEHRFLPNLENGNSNRVSETPANSAAPNQDTNQGNAPVTQSPAPTVTNGIAAPISDPASRITKKIFGTHVTPQNSPVKPERFSGYHTGLDFETTAEEKDSDVAIYAMCEGKLLTKGYASGYGGYAVQSCIIESKSVTVIYGHLRLSSIKPAVGAYIKPAEELAVLGTGNSPETDGERKHLHLGIHIGSAPSLLGYVKTQDLLSGWIDPEPVLNL